jgi:hypothetical protein
VDNTNSLTLMVWNICQGGQKDYKIKDIYGYTLRLGQIAECINFFTPSVVAIIDAFGWNKWQEGTFEHLFPEYRLEGLHPLGDIEDMNYAILVRKDIPEEVVFSTLKNLYGDRNFVSLDIYRVKIAVTYLEANSSVKRERELRAILNDNDHDIIVGDLNTIFMSERDTMFASIPKFFQYWRHFGLWLCSRQVRQSFTSPRILSEYGWESMVQASTFPLPYFWEIFLKDGIKKHTAWLWRNFFFPCPVIQFDYALQRISPLDNFTNFKALVIYTSDLNPASDHCPIIIKIDF